MQGRIALEIGEIDICAEIAKVTDEAVVSGLRRDVQSGFPAGVRPIKEERKEGMIQLCHP